MAKRVSVRKFDTKEVQGEGSYVIMTSMIVDEVRALRKADKSDKLDEFEAGMKLLERHILEWDWVDNVGKPLPIPKDDPTVIGRLTHMEADFLANLMIEAESKN